MLGKNFLFELALQWYKTTSTLSISHQPERYFADVKRLLPSWCTRNYMMNGTKSVAYVAFQFFWWAYSSAIYNQPKKTIKGNLKHVWEN